MNHLHSLVTRGLALSAVALLLASCGGGGSADSPVVDDAFYPEPENEWELVWEDEFDGDALNSENWEPQVGDGSDYGLDRWGNGEQQWYLGENATVADGLLTITARSEEVVSGFPYTSARIRSANKFDFQYGRVEVRAKAALGGGLWSAVWMLPTDTPYGTWAGSGEFDIMEVVNAGTARERVFLTAHHGFEWPLNQQAGMDVEVEGPGDEFHTYAIEWSDNLIHWFIDGEHHMTVGAEHYYSYYYAGMNEGFKNGGESAPFDVPFHLLINLAVGGNLPGTVNDADIPSEMVVDYVRVYRCTYDNDGGRGCNSNVNRLLERPGAQEPFTDSFALYTDSADSLSWLIAGEPVVRELAVNSFWDNEGSLSWMETEIDGRGSVVEVVTSNMGNISISAVDGEEIELFGFGNSPNWWEKHAGELKFDLYIDSSGTDLESDIVIKMDSGYPALGSMPLPVVDMPLDQW
ncbi:MAG: glycoside hydrolase family 16 protein, partial [Luminiphilus sp.]|nr:glycoside hydrolase family 16 protein [Luminiphilus sp.]